MKPALLLCSLVLSSAILESRSFRHGSRTGNPRLLGQPNQRQFQLPPRYGTQRRATATATAVHLMAGAGAATAAVGGAMAPVIAGLRGGAILGPATSTVAASLVSGPYGVLGLVAIASAIVTPLTIYRQAYSFSVGYALSAAAIGWSLKSSIGASGPAGSLCAAMIAYGLRLAAHLLLREATVASKKEQLVTMDKSPRLKRIPFALSVGLFYGFMAAPALFLCRASTAAAGLSETASMFATVGAALAWFGVIVEAWADGHKLLKKRGKDGAMDFHGPSGMWYGVSRHPNYAAEILFWASLFGAGLPSYFAGGVTATGGIGLVCSFLGLGGILAVMLGATKRLEGKQDEKYGGQLPYEQWKAKTAPLAPTTLKGLAASVLPGSISVGLAYLALKLTAGI